jgi:bifunctional non-homologous end joining protein LigD
LIERKAILKKILDKDIFGLYYSDHLVNQGKEFFEQSCNHGLEGIVSKRADGTYISRRSKDWLKIKCLKRQEFVIGGYSPPRGGRSYFGSLFLGVYDKNKQLEFAGNVGTGFNEKSLDEIHHLLLKNKQEKNPFTSKPPGSTRAHWVNPKFVCEVEFTEWTKDGHLRHPSFKGMRLDKKATEVKREVAMSLPTSNPSTPSSRSLSGGPTKNLAPDSRSTDPADRLREDGEKLQAQGKKSRDVAFTITNPNKILYPEDNINKQDLLNYYETVSDYILPYLSLRPLTLVRCPSEYNKCFYQRHYNKNTNKRLFATDPEEYIYLKDKEGLLSLVQMNVLEIHPWGSTIKHLDEPDTIIFDLDPAPNVGWRKVVEAAKEIRDQLARYQLTSFVKSTGGKGLHVVVPILPEYDWEKVKKFTQVFVQFLEQLKPKNYVSKMTKSRRTGKIFVDYLRNQRTATAIAAYSTRARSHAPVSTPLSWDELSNRIEDNSYTIKTLPKRLKQLKEDPWENFWKIKQSLKLDDL